MIFIISLSHSYAYDKYFSYNHHTDNNSPIHKVKIIQNILGMCVANSAQRLLQFYNFKVQKNYSNQLHPFILAYSYKLQLGNRDKIGAISSSGSDAANMINGLSGMALCKSQTIEQSIARFYTQKPEIGYLKHFTILLDALTRWPGVDNNSCNLDSMHDFYNHRFTLTFADLNLTNEEIDIYSFLETFDNFLNERDFSSVLDTIFSECSKKRNQIKNLHVPKMKSLVFFRVKDDIEFMKKKESSLFPFFLKNNATVLKLKKILNEQIIIKKNIVGIAGCANFLYKRDHESFFVVNEDVDNSLKSFRADGDCTGHAMTVEGVRYVNGKHQALVIDNNKFPKESSAERPAPFFNADESEIIGYWIDIDVLVKNIVSVSYFE